jgi:hypothetical protein
MADVKERVKMNFGRVFEVRIEESLKAREFENSKEIKEKDQREIKELT